MSPFLILVFTIVGIWFLLFLLEALFGARASQAGIMKGLELRTESVLTRWRKRVLTGLHPSEPFSGSRRYRVEEALRAELMIAGHSYEAAWSISRREVRSLLASLGWGSTE